jgi:two-component system phosphate regulon sensor histidine kinase PhoR
LDKDKLVTSLVNVLGNAAKYTPPRGRVVLRVSISDGKLSIVVEDTGVGISAEEMPRVFDKFFRSADPRVQDQVGSGLGLSLVKEVVRMHGGSVDVKSELDAGTIFTITLPMM